jgi:outer membrane receptor protein involved in Fe transport
VQSYGLTLQSHFAGADLTSVTGYNVNTFQYYPDATTLFGSTALKYYGTPYAEGLSPGDTHRVTQELRLSGTASAAFDWQIGGFYSHEKSSYPANYDAVTALTGASIGQFLHYTQSDTFEEYAAFLNFTWHATDRFDLQLGGRESHVDFNGSPRPEVGLYYTDVAHLPSPTVIAGADETGTVFTYAVTPTYKLSRDFMVYARVASGYRPGGANTTTGAPMTYGPDKTTNYELGTKAQFFDDKLSIDTSVYYIDWNDIQIQLRTPLNFSYSGNGGKAKSEGVEFSTTLRPLPDTTIAAWVSYDDARLTQDFANSPTYGLSGNVLPNTPEYSANISADQSFPFGQGWAGFVGAVASYVGDRTGPFQPKTAPTRQDFPAYTTVDVHGGVSYGSWKLSAYANNVGNTRGLIGGGLGYYEPTTFIYIPPRTYGVNVIAKF